MSTYRERVLPHLVNLTCGGATVEPLRRRVCAGLAGSVIEIGFGSGHNIPFYPSGVDRVAAVEPSDLAWQLSEPKRRKWPGEIERSGLDGEELPYPGNTFDTALSTFTLCTIPDVEAALREIRRVLTPTGVLHFLEHGLAPDPGVQRWQRRLDPLEKRLAGGCHFSRPIVELITRAGLEIIEVDTFYLSGAPRFAGAMSLGRASALSSPGLG